MKSSILFALCLVASLAVLAACRSDGCEQQVDTIDQCRLCCAEHEFNKFDHKLYMKDGLCRCYLDKSEFEPQPRAAKRQKVVEEEKTGELPPSTI